VDPFVHTRAHQWLGEALEANGDRGGACAAYAVVLARWGSATLPSVTARKARGRVAALGCGAAPGKATGARVTSSASPL
jgi:serine/threonine-protein kinase